MLQVPRDCVAGHTCTDTDYFGREVQITRGPSRWWWGCHLRSAEPSEVQSHLNDPQLQPISSALVYLGFSFGSFLPGFFTFFIYLYPIFPYFVFVLAFLLPCFPSLLSSL
ncbi:hypothetical protein BT67DRAFT_176333 [Trichocladium antarcticum]|uniref:Uncharacterized protein n=1 Tax=Trichocladium antarcticum TaxID=1450529 RepID=A0AAN6UPA6_9PEZI|nr:hypothetical protein BT67DRAFT_176333 [Trichocladium antarcticum]